MDGKIKIITIHKKESKLQSLIQDQKRLTQTQVHKNNQRKIFSNNKNSLIIPDIDSISTRKTSDSLFNNKKMKNVNSNFVYKKNLNRQKISIKVIKNQSNRNNKKSIAHSSSMEYLHTYISRKKGISNNGNNDMDAHYFNVEKNENWIHSPKRKRYKLCTEISNDIDILNHGKKNKDINQNYITDLDDYSDSNNNIINFDRKKNKKVEVINIEDLLLLEENINEVINSISNNFNLGNNCFEFINIFVNSSLNCNFDKYFTDYQMKTIIHTSINLMIYNIIITNRLK